MASPVIREARGRPDCVVTAVIILWESHSGPRAHPKPMGASRGASLPCSYLPPAAGSFRPATWQGHLNLSHISNSRVEDRRGGEQPLLLPCEAHCWCCLMTYLVSLFSLAQPRDLQGVSFNQLWVVSLWVAELSLGDGAFLELNSALQLWLPAWELSGFVPNSCCLILASQ